MQHIKDTGPQVALRKSNTVITKHYKRLRGLFKVERTHLLKQHLLNITSPKDNASKMKSTTISILATFLAVAQAAPLTSLNPTFAAKAKLVQRDSINDCGDSSFNNNSSDGSPTVADCQMIASNISGGGTWEVEQLTPSQHQLVQYGTCAFGVQTDDTSINGAYIGNQDIIDIINASIEQFEFNGLVGASGKMECQSLQGNAGSAVVEWGLYHNPS
ncbi:hypothetical protein FH972_025482 [Carpinus fangiana]|uniref:Ecp2 effector protein-like domain-containing protein n=1 Tax=Carpinus fangiana TaxID=176857 RepID=A0A5N6L1J8_9ROSI|nr:hypothetical protein FH972_025482 [Carpinus fangiana]